MRKNIQTSLGLATGHGGTEMTGVEPLRGAACRGGYTPVPWSSHGG